MIKDKTYYRVIRIMGWLLMAEMVGIIIGGVVVSC